MNVDCLIENRCINRIRDHLHRHRFRFDISSSIQILCFVYIFASSECITFIRVSARVSYIITALFNASYVSVSDIVMVVAVHIVVNARASYRVVIWM
jgi:hypothetical protein